MRTRMAWLMAGLLALACGVFSLATRARAHAPHVTSRLEPDTVSPAEAATLRVTVDASAGPPSLPSLPDVELRSVGEESQLSVTNGTAQRSVTYLYSVRADQAGDFPIAGLRVGSVPVPSVTLHVAQGSASAHSQPTAAASSEPSALAFMHVRVDKQRMYAGQSVPFTVQAYFRGGTGVTVRGRPEFSSDAFTVNGLDHDPTQKQVEIGGEPYLAVTWRGSITGVKPGDHPLEMSLPITLQYRERARVRPQSAAPRHTLRDLFGSSWPFGAGDSPAQDMLKDPFFDHMLDQPLFNDLFSEGHVVSRDLTLHDRAGQAHVSALPEQGRPADFSGAIGQFSLEASLAQMQLTRGEPVDLRLTLRGDGNFGKFAFAGLSAAPGWKAYAAQSEFKPSDKLGLRGSLEYLQPIAAEGEGPMRVPALSFSYFDPDAARYVTAHTAPIAVQVAPAARATNAASRPEGPRQSPEPLPAWSVRSLASGGVPAWLLPACIASLACALLASALIITARSRRWQRLRAGRRTARRIGRGRSAMLRAARAGDGLAYLRAGRRALQQQLAAAWSVPPESITLHELDVRWPGAPESIRRLFELADRADYGGGRVVEAPELVELPAWSRQVDAQMAHLEVPT